VEQKRKTITEVLLAAQAKKKPIHYHPRRVRLKNWLVWTAVTLCLISTPALITAGILLKSHELNVDPFLNVKNELSSYYSVSDYPSTVTLDAEAQAAKAQAAERPNSVILSIWDTEIVTRDNPQYATATYRVYIFEQSRPRWSYNLTANMSTTDGGRNWRITSINMTT